MMMTMIALMTVMLLMMMRMIEYINHFLIRILCSYDDDEYFRRTLASQAKHDVDDNSKEDDDD